MSHLTEGEHNEHVPVRITKERGREGGKLRKQKTARSIGCECEKRRGIESEKNAKAYHWL